VRATVFKRLDRPAPIEQMIARDPVQPRPEFASAFETVQPRDRLEQDLLRRVLGIRPVPQHPLSEVKDPRLVTADQRVERLDIAIPRGRSQATVLRRVVDERPHGGVH
jgi:hypothetical protein